MYEVVSRPGRGRRILCPRASPGALGCWRPRAPAARRAAPPRARLDEVALERDRTEAFGAGTVPTSQLLLVGSRAAQRDYGALQYQLSAQAQQNDRMRTVRRVA